MEICVSVAIGCHTTRIPFLGKHLSGSGQEIYQRALHHRDSDGTSARFLPKVSEGIATHHHPNNQQYHHHRAACLFRFQQTSFSSKTHNSSKNASSSASPRA